MGSFSSNDLVSEAEYDDLDLLDECLVGLVLAEGALHVLPDPLEMLLHDRHVLVGLEHVTALVFVGPPEHHRKEVLHQVVQVRYFADVLDVEDVDGLIAEDVLVEIADDPLQHLDPA